MHHWWIAVEDRNNRDDFTRFHKLVLSAVPIREADAIIAASLRLRAARLPPVVSMRAQPSSEARDQDHIFARFKLLPFVWIAFFRRH